jgi:hypothetical protein
MMKNILVGILSLSSTTVFAVETCKMTQSILLNGDMWVGAYCTVTADSVSSGDKFYSGQKDAYVIQATQIALITKTLLDKGYRLLSDGVFVKP